ncbi:putative potassium channel regulatory protein unc-93, partial [Trichinella pseudospiralis]
LTMLELNAGNLENDISQLSKSQTDQGTVVQLDSISQSSNGFMTASDYGSRVNSLVAAEPCPVHGPFGQLVPKDFADVVEPSASTKVLTSRNCMQSSGNVKRRSSKFRSSARRPLRNLDHNAWIRATIDDAADDYWKSQQLRKRLRASIPEEELEKRETEKWTVMRNLITISVAFLFEMSAFQGLQNLQTSINAEQNLGAVSLSCIYLGSVVSCLFTPGYLLNRIGCKMTMIVSMSMFTLYMLINFRTTWYSMLPGSLAMGFASAPLWAAKSTYLTETGIHYAELNFESPNIVMVRFFGIFFMVVHLGQVFGNLISSWILEAALADQPDRPQLLDAVDNTCGQFFIDAFHLSPTAAKNLRRPPISIIRSLCGVYFCCTVVSVMVLSLFLNQLRKDLSNSKKKPRFNFEVWKTTIKHLKQPRTLLLIPLTIFNGMEQAFIAADFSKGYVGCCLGISHIGSILTCFGVCNAICSVLFGPLIQLFGRMPLFMFGAVVDMLMIFTLLIWPPNPADTAIFYVVAATWGMADGVWNTQIHDLWVLLFKQNLEVAVANYRLWESVGFLIALIYHSLFPMTVKLYILLSFLLIGIVGYIFVESWDHIANRLKHGKHKMACVKSKLSEMCKDAPNSTSSDISRCQSVTPSSLATRRL